jgi:DNA-binding MarR family transcriptional regulator
MANGPVSPLVDVLSSAQRVMARDLGERLAEEGASVDQWRTLRAIGAAAGISMGTLSEHLQIPAPSLTRLVDSLVDRALVYRRQSGNDKRRIDVHVSEGGRGLLRRLESIAKDHQRSVERRIGRDQLLAAILLLEDVQAQYTAGDVKIETV